MGFLNAAGISLVYGDRTILKDINTAFNDSSRIALTGGNGSGKTSLLKILDGSLVPTEGKIHISPGTRTGYLPQTGISHTGSTLYREAEKGFAFVYPLLERKTAVEHELEKNPRNDMDLLHELYEIQEKLTELHYDRRNHEIGRVLFGLGFRKSDLERQTCEFSGGWQMRIALAKVLIARPDFLLLDEPTNYLDLEAREWLRDYIADFKGGILLVSHDRSFLDTTMSEVMELFQGNARRYSGTYSTYEVFRKKELETIAKQYEMQQTEIGRIESFIERFRYNASKARQVQSRVRLLENLERIEIPENLKTIHFVFPQPKRPGRIIASARNLSKMYGNLKALNNLEFTVEWGQKIAVTGVNGAGKTTLLRILAGKDSDYTGTIQTGPNVRIGYFDPESADRSMTGRTVIEEFESIATLEQLPKLRDLLGAFLFRGDDIYKPLEVLSGGERTRLILMRLLLRENNVLVLDEPTNHLDIHSKDILLDALSRYEGTVLFVSHDRYFLEKLAKRVWELDNGNLTVFYGDYAYYRGRKNGTTLPAESKTTGIPGAQGESKNRHEAMKRMRSLLKRLRTEEETLLAGIDSLDKEYASFEHRLTLPEVYRDGGLVRGIKNDMRRNREEHDRLIKQWEKTAADIEKNDPGTNGAG